MFTLKGIKRTKFNRSVKIFIKIFKKYLLTICRKYKDKIVDFTQKNYGLFKVAIFQMSIKFARHSK